MKKIIITFLSIFTLTGCISLKDETPPPTLFLLNAVEYESGSQTELPYSIIIDQPQIKSGLNTDRIALIHDDGRILDYFAEAKWNGRLDKVLQDFMIETFGNQFQGITISGNAIDKQADFKLVSHIHDFQAEYKNSTSSSTPPNLHVTISIFVVRLKDNKIIADYKIQDKQAASSNTLRHVTAGLQNIIQNIMTNLGSDLNKKLKE